MKWFESYSHIVIILDQWKYHSIYHYQILPSFGPNISLIISHSKSIFLLENFPLLCACLFGLLHYTLSKFSSSHHSFSTEESLFSHRHIFLIFRFFKLFPLFFSPVCSSPRTLVFSSRFPSQYNSQSDEVFTKLSSVWHNHH